MEIEEENVAREEKKKKRVKRRRKRNKRNKRGDKTEIFMKSKKFGAVRTHWSVPDDSLAVS